MSIDQDKLQEFADNLNGVLIELDAMQATDEQRKSDVYRREQAGKQKLAAAVAHIDKLLFRYEGNAQVCEDLRKLQGNLKWD